MADRPPQAPAADLVMPDVRIRDEHRRETLAEYVQALWLVTEPGCVYRDGPSGAILGYLRTLPSGVSVTVTCRLHRECTYFLNVRTDFETTAKLLVGWLSAGRDVDGRDAHQLVRYLCQ